MSLRYVRNSPGYNMTDETLSLFVSNNALSKEAIGQSKFQTNLPAINQGNTIN